MVKVIKTAAYSVLLLFSLVGNSLVPAIVYRNPLLHTSVNYFIASMSISDLLIPIFAYPEQISYFHAGFYVRKIDGWFGSLLCKLKDFAKDTSVIVTVLTLMIVSYERFLAVVYPLRRQHLRRRKSCFIAISLTWVFAMLYSSQHFYNWRLKTVNGTTYCILFSGTLIEGWIYTVCFLIIPFFVLTCFYSSIIVSLKRKKTPGLSENEQRKRKSKEYRRITYMLMANVVLFFVSFPGSHLFFTFFFYNLRDDLPCATVLFVLDYLRFTYQAFNPCIYCVFNSRYRQGFKEILCCVKTCTFCTESREEAPGQIEMAPVCADGNPKELT